MNVFSRSVCIVVVMVTLCVPVNGTYGQSGLWAWATSKPDCLGIGVCTDSYGNVYQTGVFTGKSLTFGSTTLKQDSLGDMYVVKYNRDGEPIWASSATGPRLDQGKGICTDRSGNVYVVGSSTSLSMMFGSKSYPNVFPSTTNYAGFIVKYDSEGNIVWQTSVGWVYWDELNAVTTDAAGNVYAVGYSQGSELYVGTTKLTFPGLQHMILLKFDKNGNLLWGRASAGGYMDVGRGVAADSSGNIFVTGYFNSAEFVVGSFSLKNSVQSSPMSYDSFIVKYDSEGNVLWAKSAGNESQDYSYGVAADHNGNAYITGTFGGSTINFGLFTLINPYSRKMFVVRYNPDGNVSWAISGNIHTSGTDGAQDGNNIACDNRGHVYTVCYSSGDSVTFGNITLNLKSGRSFVAEFDTTGTALSLSGAGSDLNFNAFYAVAPSIAGGVYVTGVFKYSDISFGSITLQREGIADMFIAKLDAVSSGVSKGFETHRPDNNRDLEKKCMVLE